MFEYMHLRDKVLNTDASPIRSAAKIATAQPLLHAACERLGEPLSM